jgi:hypothetical protein
MEQTHGDVGPSESNRRAAAGGVPSTSDLINPVHSDAVVAARFSSRELKRLMLHGDELVSN